MPLHDWSRVESGIIHDFHTAWITEIRNALNAGLLSKDYYAVDIYLEHVARGMPLPDMPIFLNPDRYVNVPVEATYLEAWKGMPSFWRDVVVGKSAG
jgi:hypothetical protein